MLTQDIHEKLKARAERKTQIALSYSDPKKAEEFHAQGILDEQDYRTIMRHHAFQSRDQNSLDSALRSGFISYEEYAETYRKLIFSIATGDMLLDGNLEGIVEDSEMLINAGESFDKEQERETEKYKKLKEEREFELAYFDGIYLKPDANLIKVARTVTKFTGKHSFEEDLSYLPEDNIRKVITQLKRSGLIVPEEIQRHHDEDETEHLLHCFIRDFWEFIDTQKPEINEQLRQEERKREKQKEIKEMQEEEKRRREIMQQVGAKSWDQVGEFGDNYLGWRYYLKNPNQTPEQ